MEVEKTEKNIAEDDESKIIYRGWKVMPFIIGIYSSIFFLIYIYIYFFFLINTFVCLQV